MRKIFLLLIISFLICSCDLGVERRKNNRKMEKFSGIVVEKYRDKWQHNAPMLRLDNDKVISISVWELRGSDYLWPFIKIGDSIVKCSGSLDLEVIKPSGSKKTFPYRDNR